MKKVITYGTFDLFHEGHYNILKRAKEYGDYLIVGVTGENYDIGRGKLSVHDSLAVRIENVRNSGFADEIIVEEYLGQKISDIVRYDVDAFVIGDDWRGKFDHLARYCNLVYLERTKGVSSTQIRKEILKKYNIGIITDIPDDNQIVKEARLLNNYQVSSVYSDDSELKEYYLKEYNIENAAESISDLIESSDIVYLRCEVFKRADLVRTVLNKGKHVICDPPCAMSAREQEELLDLAKSKGLILMENYKMVNIHVFNQLLWMTQGGLIGEILSFNCSVSRNDRKRNNIFYDLLAMALCPTFKIMGLDYKDVEAQITSDEGGIEFASLNFRYDTGRVVVNVGNKIRVRNRIEIIGTNGTITSEGNWWRGSYFELSDPKEEGKQIFNTNYQGNGFKYLLRAMSTMLDNNRTDSMGVFRDESIKIAEVVEKIRTESVKNDN